MSASLAPECNEVKERYDTCFLKWYSEKFLRGNATTDECEPLFRQYKQCINRALQERGIDKMVDEARESNRENDAEHMKGNCKHNTLLSSSRVLMRTAEWDFALAHNSGANEGIVTLCILIHLSFCFIIQIFRP